MKANIETAQSLFKQTKYQEAIDTCKEILATDKNSIETIKLIAKSFLATRNIEDARLYLNKALNIKPDDYEVMKDLGNTYQAIGDNTTAKNYYQKALIINGSFAPALTNLGSIELKKGNKQEALSLFIKATQSDPLLAPAWGNLANCYFQLGQVEEAELSTRKAIHLNQSLFNSHFLLSSILIGQKKLQEAEQALRKTIELNPNYFQAHLNLGGVLKDLGRLQEAKIFIHKSIKINPNLFSSHSLLASILIKEEKLQEAEQPLRKTIELNPNSFQAHLNLGEVLKKLGKLQEAAISTRQAIELNPSLSDSHLQLSTILTGQNKLKEAEITTRNAIELNPNFADAYTILGSILRQLGKLEEGEISHRKAIELNPNSSVAYYNLGNIFKDQGKLEEAEISHRKAIELNPNFSGAYCNLGNVLSDLGKLQEAFSSYLKSMEINPILPNIYESINNLLKDADPSKLNTSKLKNILNILLKRNDIYHQNLFKAFNFLFSNEIITNLEKLDSDSSKIKSLVNDEIIINALKKIVFHDPKLEKVLIKSRRNICHRIAKNIEYINCSELQFIIALGEQCFLNEYVYSFTEEENKSIDKIIQNCRNHEVTETNISILSCYFPLYKLLDQIPSLKSFTSSNQRVIELTELQITEPLKEIELSRNIKKIGSINDAISKKVKSQYEENPYPRWRYGNHSESQKISIAKGINNEIDPNSISKDIEERKLKVLVAGCGTGQQILHTQIYKNAQITGIDLSVSSLSYAQRKIKELEINNVELLLMDILEISLLEKKFDLIICSGVLHHMNDPLKGLKALVGVLKNNGFLKLGLYSEIARKDIIKARNYINSNTLQASEDSIRDFRESIFSGKTPALNSLTMFPDFYTLSSCRDLCFHAQEHRFIIKQLDDTLKSNELEFLGFLLPKAVKTVYKKYFPEDKKQTNLKNWEKFEEKHPDTFIGMYQFWVCKR